VQKELKKYFDKCLKLALRNRYAREFFCRIGVLFLLTAPFKALETPEIREYTEKLSRVLEEGDKSEL
jgi:hypothetical protein